MTSAWSPTAPVIMTQTQRHRWHVCQGASAPRSRNAKGCQGVLRHRGGGQASAHLQSSAARVERACNSSFHATLLCCRLAVAIDAASAHSRRNLRAGCISEMGGCVCKDRLLRSSGTYSKYTTQTHTHTQHVNKMAYLRQHLLRPPDADDELAAALAQCAAQLSEGSQNELGTVGACLVKAAGGL